MTTLLSTGELARLLNTTEPRIAELDRRGKVTPRPQVIAGRRLWTREQALQAGELLKLLTPEIRCQLEADVSEGA